MEYKTAQVTEEKRMIRGDGARDATLLGAFPNDSTVFFELTFPRDFAAVETAMVIEGDPIEGEGKRRRVTGRFSAARLDRITFSFEVDMRAVASELSGGDTGLFYYHYELETPDGPICLGGEGREPELCDKARQLLVYDSSFETPERLCGGIIYQIFPDRFRRSGRVSPPHGRKIDDDWTDGVPQYAERPGDPVENDVFFGGDLYGVSEKLPYLKTLGVTAIYLNPVFSSPSNHRYDTADYMRTDDLLGGDDALLHLITEAKENGIDVILDGVFAHTGADSVYFNKYGRYPPQGACDDPASPYFGWYSFKKYPSEYDCWWSVDSLPKVNADEPSYRSFILGPFLRKWNGMGVSGWRIDVADELSDDFLSSFRRELKNGGKEKYLVGEVWEDASDKVSYGKRREYLRGRSLDSVMNYVLRRGLIGYMLRGDADGLRYATETLYRHYPKPASDVLMNALSTHDTVRILTAFGDEGYEGLPGSALARRRLDPEKRKIASLRVSAAYGALAALPGLPTVYYGDEAGLEGYRDPFCRMPYPWGREDAELLREFRRIGKFRKNEPLLRKGLFRILYLDPEVFVFSREPWNGESDFVLVAALNRTDSEREVSFPFEVVPYDGGEPARAVTLAPVSCSYYKRPGLK